jgi:RNA polymerase sigma-70 factor (ECF subfamily)
MNPDPASHAWDWTRLRQICLKEARRVSICADDAEDVAQEAVTRAWRMAHLCRTPEHPEPWIRTIAHNEALRNRGRRLDRQESPEPEPIDELASGSHLSLEIRSAVRALAPLDRELVFQRYWSDMRQADIARGAGMPEGTVKVRLHRARSALAAVLQS